jgi:putative hemolysin
MVATILVGGGIVYFELILGELVPKALALRFTDTVALLVAPPLWWLARFSRGLVKILTASTRGVLWVFRVREFAHRTFVSEEEIKHLVTEGRHQGVLDKDEEELIHSVFEFSETPVKKVMVPRPKIFALDVNTAPGEVEHLIVEGGYTRIPVYDATPDNVIGLVYIKDVIRLLERRQPIVLRKILHPVHFVPETKKVGDLLKELQKRRTHMALVIDEHGSLVGLVTLEDLLEEIVGEIQDEYDWEERPVERLRDGSLVVDGTLSAADLRASYQIPIPESTEFETVAGFMLEKLGTVPRGGEFVDLGGFRLTVVDVEKNRISKVKIDKVPAAAAAKVAPKPVAAKR